jgi:peroxiredoxin
MTVPAPGRLVDLLDAYRAEDDAMASPQASAIFALEAARLARPGWDAGVPRIGEAAPDVAMPDAPDPPVSLLDLARAGPLVLKFYRGRWCPYCTLDMRAWQRAAPRLQALGARFVAVTPQSGTEIATMRERDGLALHVASDAGHRLARAFGVSYEVDPAVRAHYAAQGLDIGSTGENGDWELPLPACFVIGRDARVAWSHVDADYTRRAEPDAVLDAVAALVPDR